MDVNQTHMPIKPYVIPEGPGRALVRLTEGPNYQFACIVKRGGEWVVDKLTFFAEHDAEFRGINVNADVLIELAKTLKEMDGK